MRQLAGSLILIALLASPALAREADAPQGPPRRSVGLGILAAPDPYKGSDTDFFPIPIVVLRGERVSFVGVRLSVHAWKQGPWSLDAIAQPRFAGFDPDDSPFLEGMEEREFSLDAGLELTWQSPKWAVSVDVLQDLLSRSEGFETSVSLQRRYSVRRWFIVPSVGLGWQSDKLVDYYYGVRRGEVREGRPFFEPGSALVPSVGLDVTYVFRNPRWSARALADIELYPGSVKDSPIIDDGYGAFLALAAAYNF